MISSRPKSTRRLRHVLFLTLGLALVLGPVSVLTPGRVAATAPAAYSGYPATAWQDGKPYFWPRSGRQEAAAGLLGLVPPYRSLPSLPAADPCDPVPGENYAEIWVNQPPSDRPAEQHADLNLILRGYASANASKELVFYNGDTDNKAPQLSGLFGDDRTGRITSVYRVYDWDWDSDSRGKLLSDPEVTLVGLEVTPGEIFYVPPAGYTIGSGYDVLVLYASPLRITLKYTRDDNVARGYTLHIENICVEPNLLGVYQACNAAGRGHLPALQAGQAIGRARGNEVGVAIRDNGIFLDPRSNKDWWRGR